MGGPEDIEMTGRVGNMMLDLGFMLTGLTPHIIILLLFWLDRVAILGPLLEVIDGSLP